MQHFQPRRSSLTCTLVFIVLTTDRALVLDSCAYMACRDVGDRGGLQRFGG